MAFGVLMRQGGNSLGFLVSDVKRDGPSGGVLLRVNLNGAATGDNALILDGGTVARIVEAHRVSCPFGCPACVPEPALSGSSQQVGQAKEER